MASREALLSTLTEMRRSHDALMPQRVKALTLELARDRFKRERDQLAEQVFQLNGEVLGLQSELSAARRRLRELEKQSVPSPSVAEPLAPMPVRKPRKPAMRLSPEAKSILGRDPPDPAAYDRTITEDDSE